MSNSRSTLRISALFHARGFASQEEYRAYRRQYLQALQNDEEPPEIPQAWHDAATAQVEAESATTAAIASGTPAQEPIEADPEPPSEPDTEEVVSIGSRPVPWPWLLAGAALLIAGVYYYSGQL